MGGEGLGIAGEGWEVAGEGLELGTTPLQPIYQINAY